MVNMFFSCKKRGRQDNRGMPVWNPIRRAMVRIFVLCFSVALMPGPLHAAFKGGDTSIIKGKQKQKLKAAVSAVKSMPRIAREAFYAEMLGLSYKPDGAEAMKASSQGNSSTYRGSRFVGTDGKEHDWISEYSTTSSDKWEKAKALCKEVDVNTALAAFSGDITKMIHRTAKSLLDSMPVELRDCWLSEVGGLMYMKDGTPGYTGKDHVDRSEAGYDVPHPAIAHGALFTDTKGEERDIYKLLGVHEKKWLRRYNVLHACAMLVGKEEILNLYADEMKLMSRFHRKRTADADPDAPPPPSTETAASLKNWPEGAREAFLAERLGLCFMPGSTEAAYDHRSWVRHGAHYIGADGKEYDFWKRSEMQTDRSEWERVCRLYDREKHENVMSDMEAAVAQLQQSFQEHAPEAVRKRKAGNTAMGAQAL